MSDSVWANAKPPEKTGITAKKEFEETLLPCIDQSKSSVDNWLVKALIGLNPKNIERMLDAPAFDKLDRASEFTGAVANYPLEYEKVSIKRLKLQEMLLDSINL